MIMLWVLSFSGFMAVFGLIFSLSNIFNKRAQVQERLANIKIADGREERDSFALPFYERVINPIHETLTRYFEVIAPREIRNSLDKTLEQAGHPWNLTVYSLILFQVVLGGLFLIITWIISSFAPAIIVGGIGFIIPYIVVNQKATLRKEKIQKSLPDFLDMLFVSVEAGLGFDMALKRVAGQIPGDLSNEFQRALEEIRVGRVRSEALRNVTKRIGDSDLNTFVNSIIQAEQLGSNIGNTLRVQSEIMRRKRRQRAEEKAMKAPVKMLFPIIFFIFPSLFVVILGPAGINIMRVLTDFF